MSTTVAAIEARRSDMRAGLPPMLRTTAVDYGRKQLGGTALDKLLANLVHAPDGSPPDANAAEVLIAFADHLREFAEIIRDKPHNRAR